MVIRVRRGNMNERYYIKRIRQGDHRALDLFIEELYPQVYTFIHHKIQDEALAYDLTQDVFVRFIRALPTYRSEGKVLNYLYTIASRVCLSYLKTQKQNLVFCDEIFIDEAQDIHEDMLKHMTQDYLQTMIYQLKPEYQDIIILKYFHAYTFKDISKIYHLPESTVKTRHYQALKQLKKWIERDEKNGISYRKNKTKMS